MRQTESLGWRGLSGTAWGSLHHHNEGFYRQLERQRAGHWPRPRQCMQGLRGTLGPGFCVHILVLPLPGTLGQATHYF